MRVDEVNKGGYLFATRGSHFIDFFDCNFHSIMFLFLNALGTFLLNFFFEHLIMFVNCSHHSARLVETVGDLISSNFHYKSKKLEIN